MRVINTIRNKYYLGRILVFFILVIYTSVFITLAVLMSFEPLQKFATLEEPKIGLTGNLVNFDNITSIQSVVPGLDEIESLKYRSFCLYNFSRYRLANGNIIPAWVLPENGRMSITLNDGGIYRVVSASYGQISCVPFKLNQPFDDEWGSWSVATDFFGQEVQLSAHNSGVFIWIGWKNELLFIFIVALFISSIILYVDGIANLIVRK